MINFEKVRKILKSNLTVDQYIYLKAIEENESQVLKEFPDNIPTSLQFKGFLQLGSLNLTKKAKSIIEEIEKVDKTIDFKAIHNRMGDKLYSLKGKRQIIGYGGIYFICTAKELEVYLSRFWKVYPECNDIVKIEAILLNQIEKCCKTGKFAPAMRYFILKDKVNSGLAAIYDSFREEQIIEKKEDSQQNFEL